jgi:nitroimidazol reductase NimA-like FMN-containing flavoprotein (pyridoxamine 5'-phosphate oxidase superfamily)
MKPLEKFKQQLHALLASQKLAVVATSDGGAPYASLVAFVVDEDLRHIYFVTSRSTRKYAYLAADSRVAVLVDSSTNTDADFHRAVSVTARGTASEIRGPARTRQLDHYLSKHPYLQDFAEAPTCALIDVRVDVYIMVKNFQNVMEWHITDALGSTD